MKPDRPNSGKRIPFAYEQMLRLEQIAGDPTNLRGTRMRALRAARFLRWYVERVTENE